MMTLYSQPQNHYDYHHVDQCVIPELEYSKTGPLIGVHGCFTKHLVKLWVFDSSELFSFHLIGGIDSTYKITQFLFVSQSPTNSRPHYQGACV